MINLLSTDTLTLGTATAGAISAHVSWIDQINTTITPGRTNTASITTVATTTILAAPSASTMRNAKFISIFNTHATLSNVLTLTHTDGTNPITILTINLAAGESVSWVEGRGWERCNSNGVPITLGQTGPVDVQVFTSSANWIMPTAFAPTQVLVKLWGAGGGGGGGGSIAVGTACRGGAGGGGGACAIKYFLASELTTTVVVTLAAGGSAGAGTVNSAGTNGGNGGTSTFGAYFSAYSGGGGTAGAVSAVSVQAGGGGGLGSSAVLGASGTPAVSVGADGNGMVGWSGNSANSSEFGGNSGQGMTATGTFFDSSSLGFTAIPSLTGSPAVSSYVVASVFGGSGGGAAGSRTATGQAIGPNSGILAVPYEGAWGRAPGATGITQPNSGTATSPPTVGGAGAAGNSIWGGSGGGAGGNSNFASLNGAAGGAGGQGGGGGGGGGLAPAGGAAGGAGGTGGAGYCVVISW